MRMKHSTVAEVDQLVLAATLHARDGGAAERSEATWREAPLQRGVQKANFRDGASDDALAKNTHCGFDFW
jgi:hypothetical protein